MTDVKVAPDGEHSAGKMGMQQAGGHSHGHGHGHGHSHLAISRLGSKNIASNLRSLLVILALSFHSVFEVRIQIITFVPRCFSVIAKT